MKAMAKVFTEDNLQKSCFENFGNVQINMSVPET